MEREGKRDEGGEVTGEEVVGADQEDARAAELQVAEEVENGLYEEEERDQMERQGKRRKRKLTFSYCSASSVIPPACANLLTHFQ